MVNITCVFTKHAKEVTCNGILYKLGEEQLTPKDTTFWVYLGMYIFLMLFAGLMSGLTMGLLSLGETQLEILEKAGKPKEKKYANRIYPLVKRHHLLLVTLLLANAAAVETMPIFMDRITNPVVAIVISVTAVLLFGEIIPQALCTRYGLAIGYYLAPIVYFLICLLFIISWPISKLLDLLLGGSHATFFRRAELKELVDIHQIKGDDESNEEPLSLAEAMIIKGALDLKDKVAIDAYVPLDAVFMLEDNIKLDRTTMKNLNDRGHSRVPVFKGTRENIVGVLLVKSIIAADPDDADPIIGYVKGGVHIHYENDPLYDILHECRRGKCHLCIVKRKTDQGDITVGIITLEDVIEEILQAEIVDETDEYEDVVRRLKVSCAQRKSLFRSTSTTGVPPRHRDFSVTVDPVLCRSMPGRSADDDEKTPLIR